jgi:hypothetical protein
MRLSALNPSEQITSAVQNQPAPFAIMAWLRKVIVELPRERAETRRGTGSRRASRRAIAIRT